MGILLQKVIEMQFYKRVQQQALKCNFGDTNTEIKQQFIIATSSNKQTLLFL